VTTETGIHSGLEDARQQAAAQLENIAELLKGALDYGGVLTDQLIEELEELPLELLVRGPREGWTVPGAPLPADWATPAEFQILLCTGGPAVRLTGRLDWQSCTPYLVQLEYQSWWAPWTVYPLSSEEVAVLLEFSQLFFWGE
jgi:hypothetical protein